MKRLTWTASLCLLVLPLLASAASALLPQHGVAPAQRTLAEADRKLEAGRILLKWGGYVEKVEGLDRQAWAARLWPSLASADLGNLQKASRAVTYEGMRNALLGQRPYDEEVIDRMAKADVGSGKTVGKALGSLASDLVFTPITPCRIVDTRVVGGRIARNGTRNLIASNPAGTFLGQGGASTNCGIPANPAALALSVTGLNNTNTGYLRVFPANGTNTQGSPIPLNTLNTTVTNDIIVPACQACASDLKVFSTATTHYAAFVTGYYMAPQVTELECYTAYGIANPVPDSAGIWDFGAPVCTAGYMHTLYGCYSDNMTVISIGFSNRSCRFIDTAPGNGISGNAHADSRCCRVPGR